MRLARITALTSIAAVALGCAGGTSDAETFYSMTNGSGSSDTADTGDEIGTETVGTDTVGTDTTTDTVGTDTVGTDTVGTDTTDTTGTDTTGGPLCSRSLYTYDVDQDSWDEVALDAVWAGANAPPCAVEPAAAVYIELWDQLLVFGSDQMLYRRDGGAWQAPQPLSQLFGVVAGKTIHSAYYVPPINGSPSANITFVSFPDAVLYEFYEDGSAVYDQTVMLEDEPEGPAQGQFPSRWAANFADPDLLGNSADWWEGVFDYTNGEIWYANGSFVWQGWPENQSPYFDGADAPNPASLEAAWGDFDLQRFYFVGPG